MHTFFCPPLPALLQLLLVLLLGVGEGKEAFIVFWVRRRRSRTQPSGLEETLNKVEVGVWSDFACLVAFLEIAEFCSKSTKTQRGTPLRVGHRPIPKIINYFPYSLGAFLIHWGFEIEAL